MRTRWLRYALTLAMALGVFTGSFQSVAGLQVSTPQPPIVIDFETVVTVPYELHQPIESAMGSSRSALPTETRFTVTALRRSGDWMEAILVPTRVVEAGWEVQLGQDEVIQILGHRVATGRYLAFVCGTPAASRLEQDVPREFIDFSAPATPMAPTSVDYLFQS